MKLKEQDIELVREYWPKLDSGLTKEQKILSVRNDLLLSNRVAWAIYKLLKDELGEKRFRTGSKPKSETRIYDTSKKTGQWPTPPEPVTEPVAKKPRKPRKTSKPPKPPKEPTPPKEIKTEPTPPPPPPEPVIIDIPPPPNSELAMFEQSVIGEIAVGDEIKKHLKNNGSLPTTHEIEKSLNMPAGYVGKVIKGFNPAWKATPAAMYIKDNLFEVISREMHKGKEWAVNAGLKLFFGIDLDRPETYEASSTLTEIMNVSHEKMQKVHELAETPDDYFRLLGIETAEFTEIDTNTAIH